MKDATTRVRVYAFLLAVLTSSLLLGATVVGMQPDLDAGGVLVAIANIASVTLG